MGPLKHLGDSRLLAELDPVSKKSISTEMAKGTYIVFDRSASDFRDNAYS